MANLVENASLYAGGVTRVDRRATSRRVTVRRGRRSHPGHRRGPRAGHPPRTSAIHLFERFYRGSRAGQRASSEGTGLGLSLVAEHVRLHGGAVWIEDAPGRGSRFVVELPLSPDESHGVADVTIRARRWLCLVPL